MIQIFFLFSFFDRLSVDLLDDDGDDKESQECRDLGFSDINGDHRMWKILAEEVFLSRTEDFPWLSFYFFSKWLSRIEETNEKKR